MVLFSPHLLLLLFFSMHFSQMSDIWKDVNQIPRVFCSHEVENALKKNSSVHLRKVFKRKNKTKKKQKPKARFKHHVEKDQDTKEETTKTRNKQA